MRFHAEVPPVAFLALMHLRVTFARRILGRARSAEQRRVYHRACAQHQPLVAQNVVDQREDLGSQLVLLRQMAESQNGALVGQPHRPVVHPGELPVQRHVVHLRERAMQRILSADDASNPSGKMRAGSGTRAGLIS